MQQRKHCEKNGDIYCSLIVASAAALTHLQKELTRHHFTYTQVLETRSIDTTSKDKLGIAYTAEFLLVVTTGQKLFQYLLHPCPYTDQNAFVFTERHKLYMTKDYLEVVLKPDQLPPYSSFEILA